MKGLILAQNERWRRGPNPGFDPALVDFAVVKENKKVEGIYKFEKKQLIICWNDEDGNRPSEFTSNGENRNGLIVLRRAKE